MRIITTYSYVPMGTGESDEQLMLDYGAGEDSAFEILYKKHKGPLYRYLLRGCSNAAVADELFQDVWVKLINARRRYEPRAKFTTWLYHLAHNRLMDYYRRNSITVVQNDSESIEAVPAAASQNPDQKLQQSEQIERLLDLVRQLPDDQREAFLLREEAGLSVTEIAEITGVGQETAKSRLRYAVKKLRDGMQGWI